VYAEAVLIAEYEDCKAMPQETIKQDDSRKDDYDKIENGQTDRLWLNFVHLPIIPGFS
jgi:hypothetical protein